MSLSVPYAPNKVLSQEALTSLPHEDRDDMTIAEEDQFANDLFAQLIACSY
jgi:hypothetical protein